MTTDITVKVYLDTGVTYEYEVSTPTGAREHAQAIVKRGYVHTSDGFMTHFPPHRIDKVKCGPGMTTHYPDRVGGKGPGGAAEDQRHGRGTGRRTRSHTADAAHRPRTFGGHTAMTHSAIFNGAGFYCRSCGVAWDQGEDAPGACQPTDASFLNGGPATEPRRIVVALAGEKGSGKDTAARPLIEMGFTNVKLAGALKDMLRAYLRYRRCPEDLIERMIDGDLKETPSRYLNGRTPRHAQQTLGTEWGRQMMHPRFWIDAVTDHVESLDRFVITDVRFLNEGEYVRQELGATLFRVERPDGWRTTDNHSSETEIARIQVDGTLINIAPSAAEFQRRAKIFFAARIPALT